MQIIFSPPSDNCRTQHDDQLLINTGCLVTSTLRIVPNFIHVVYDFGRSYFFQGFVFDITSFIPNVFKIFQNFNGPYISRYESVDCNYRKYILKDMDYTFNPDDCVCDYKHGEMSLDYNPFCRQITLNTNVYNEMDRMAYYLGRAWPLMTDTFGCLITSVVKWIVELFRTITALLSDLDKMFTWGFEYPLNHDRGSIYQPPKLKNEKYGNSSHIVETSVFLGYLLQTLQKTYIISSFEVNAMQHSGSYGLDVLQKRFGQLCLWFQLDTLSACQCIYTYSPIFERDVVPYDHSLKPNFIKTINTGVPL